MKKSIFIIFIFLFSFNTFAKEQEIDYSKYYLKGVFKKEVFREDYYWLWEFHIYDNKIYNAYYGDEAGGGNSEMFPSGEYTLETYNKSKIKINVKDGKILNFNLLSNKEAFKKNEKKVEDNNTCFNSYYLINWQDAYKPNSIKYFEVRNNEVYKLYNFFYILYYKHKNKILTSSGDNHYTEQMYSGDFYFKFEDNYLIPININKEKSYDLYIKDCILIDYNKEKINL